VSAKPLRETTKRFLHDMHVWRESRKLEAKIVEAAREWCHEPETIDAYESLRGTNSASAPGAFMCLYEAVEDLEKLQK
jgi:hypothetical protein